MSIKEDFELLSKVQHNLYQKCIEYGAYGRYETQQTVNGTKILADREQEKEQEY